MRTDDLLDLLSTDLAPAPPGLVTRRLGLGVILGLAVGALTGWYPYPFLDPATDGAAAVVVTCLGITAFTVAVMAALVAVDRRLPVTPPASAATR